MGVDGLDGEKRAELVLERKSIYGNDMLYCALPDGQRIGSYNLGTGKRSLKRSDLSDSFEKAIQAWLAAHPEITTRETPDDLNLAPGTRGSSSGAVLDQLQQTEGTVEWTDLAANRPGAQVKKKANEIRRAAPFKSLVAGLLDIRTEETNWRNGAWGERKVATRLQDLGNEWAVLHAIPVGERGADIDHLVIGPAGVFTINTKTHLGKEVWVSARTFKVDGFKQDYLPKASAEAQRATRLLSVACGFDVAVRPLLVVLAEKVTVSIQPSDVHVLTSRQVSPWLATLPETISTGRAEVIYARAQESRTWTMKV